MKDIKQKEVTYISGLTEKKTPNNNIYLEHQVERPSHIEKERNETGLTSPHHHSVQVSDAMPTESKKR